MGPTLGAIGSNRRVIGVRCDAFWTIGIINQSRVDISLLNISGDSSFFLFSIEKKVYCFSVSVSSFSHSLAR